MTEQEQMFILQCEKMIENIQMDYPDYKAATLVCVNALREQINKTKGVPGSRTEVDGQSLLVGLTFDDIRHMHNGGSITVDTAGTELPPMTMCIFLGGTHEHMAKGMEKHPDTDFKFIDSHRDTKN